MPLIVCNFPVVPKPLLAARLPPLNFATISWGMEEEQRTLVVYEFSRPKIERGDFSRFLGTYGFDRLPTGRRLRSMMDNMVFMVDGWNNDSREVHTIPEVTTSNLCYGKRTSFVTRHFYS